MQNCRSRFSTINYFPFQTDSYLAIWENLLIFVFRNSIPGYPIFVQNSARHIYCISLTWKDPTFLTRDVATPCPQKHSFYWESQCLIHNSFVGLETCHRKWGYVQKNTINPQKYSAWRLQTQVLPSILPLKSWKLFSWVPKAQYKEVGCTPGTNAVTLVSQLSSPASVPVPESSYFIHFPSFQLRSESLLADMKQRLKIPDALLAACSSAVFYYTSVLSELQDWEFDLLWLSLSFASKEQENFSSSLDTSSGFFLLCLPLFEKIH